MIYISGFLLIFTISICIYAIYIPDRDVNYYWIILLVLAIWQILAFMNKKTMYAGAVPIKYGEHKIIRLFEFILFFVLWIAGLFFLVL